VQLDLQEYRFYCKWFKIKSSINNKHVVMRNSKWFMWSYVQHHLQENRFILSDLQSNFQSTIGMLLCVIQCDSHELFLIMSFVKKNLACHALWIGHWWHES
jgi:hypothetical protein